MNKRAVGTEYEGKAAAYLESQGYHILARNYRCRLGEIDLIAQDGDYLVFCEVKYRKNKAYGYPSEAVTLSKQRTIRLVAQWYLKDSHCEGTYFRFDVIAILGDQLEHIRNAF